MTVGETLLKSAAAPFLKVFKDNLYNSGDKRGIIPLKVRFPSNEQKTPSLLNRKTNKPNKKPRKHHTKQQKSYSSWTKQYWIYDTY